MTLKNHVYVHLIESPSSDDLLDGVTEGRTLSSFLELASIPCCYNLVTSEATLNKALKERLVEAASHHDKVPIIHFSGHGNNNGIQLTDETFLEWKQLATLLAPINVALQGSLILCLSVCSGISGSKMSLNDLSSTPINTLIATRGTPTWQEAAVAFVTFYHHVINVESPFDIAIEAMKVASSHDHFEQVRSADVQAVFKRFLALAKTQQQAVIDALREGARKGSEAFV